MATFIRGAAVPGAKAYRLYDVSSGEEEIAKKTVKQTFPFAGSVNSNGKPNEVQTDILQDEILKGKFPIMQTNQHGKCYYKFTGNAAITFQLYSGDTYKEYEDFVAYWNIDSYVDKNIQCYGLEAKWNDEDAKEYQTLYININDGLIPFRTLTSQDYPVKEIRLNGSLTVHHADGSFKHTDFIPVANLSNKYENDNGTLIEKPFCVTGFTNSGNNDLVMAFYNDASFATATGTEITKAEAGGTSYIAAETVQGFANGAEYVVFFAKGTEQDAYVNAGGIDFRLDDYHGGALSANKTYQLAVRALADGDNRFEDGVLSNPISYTKS